MKALGQGVGQRFALTADVRAVDAPAQEAPIFLLLTGSGPPGGFPGGAEGGPAGMLSNWNYGITNYDDSAYNGAAGLSRQLGKSITV
jgi:hypothetical protein